jgi:hypothetical protein
MTTGDSSPVVEDVEMAVAGEEKVVFLGVFKSGFVRQSL